MTTTILDIIEFKLDEQTSTLSAVASLEDGWDNGKDVMDPSFCSYPADYETSFELEDEEITDIKQRGDDAVLDILNAVANQVCWSLLSIND